MTSAQERSIDRPWAESSWTTRGVYKAYNPGYKALVRQLMGFEISDRENIEIVSELTGLYGSIMLHITPLGGETFNIEMTREDIQTTREGPRGESTVRIRRKLIAAGALATDV